MPETRIKDYISFLRELGEGGAGYFLEGGQAVNFWAEYFSAKGDGELLGAFQPFTSRDCDVLIVDVGQFKRIEQLAGGRRLIKGSSPADGQLGVLRLSNDPDISVDLMTGVYGIPPRKIPWLIQRALEINGIRVIDPISLFLSKCHCLLGLDQTNRQDEKHLRILCCVVPLYLQELIKEAQGKQLNQRALIKETKLLIGILKRSRVRRALRQIGIQVKDLIPITQFLGCGLTTIERFAGQLGSDFS